MLNNAWLIIWLPLFGFLFNAFSGMIFGKATAKKLVSLVAPAVVLAAFAVAVLVLMEVQQQPEHRAIVSLLPWAPADAPWIKFGGFQVNFGLLLDPLSMLMALIVTGVGGLIHIYAVGYMADDREVPRFFTYFNLFIVMMLLLVLGENFLLMFVGWEGVGTCSYLLISFWYTTTDNAKAGNKAFIVNRVGDLGFSLGMMTIWSFFGTLSFRNAAGTGVLDLVSHMDANNLHYAPIDALGHPVPVAIITGICFLLFVGAMGKSAQIPLWVWLPDAMAGPTPVSALIHAATMVTAGVVMLTRCSFLFVQAPQALQFVAWIGIATAFVGATVGLVQNDIKRVLAFSTVSQLGYMFLACGVGDFASGMFHVTTHAFFKAMLFMGSGAVIHSMQGEQDMRKMGGLRKLIPRTYWIMVIGTYAIAGFPGLSGFWSKDAILDSAFKAPWGGEMTGKILYGLGLVTALMTAFYMNRMMWKTFYTDQRFEDGKLEAQHHSNFDDEHDVDGHHTGHEEKTDGADAHAAHGHGHGGKVHESPFSMMLPLYILAVFTIGFGFLVGPWGPGATTLKNGEKVGGFVKFLEPSVAELGRGAPTLSIQEEGMSPIMGYIISSVIAIAGLSLAFFLYGKNRKTGQLVPVETEKQWIRKPTNVFAFAYDTFYSKWGFDAVYNFVFITVGGQIATFLWKIIDVGLIDGLITGLGYLVGGVSKLTKRAQTGLVRNYALAMLFGVVALVSSLLYTWNHLNFK